jgi:flagellar hook-associated protein 2
MATVGSSSIDVNGIVSQLMQVERRPITLLNRNISGITTQLSSFGKLQSSLSALQDAARTLNRTDTWNAAKGSSGDPAAVEVSAGAGAGTGKYAVNISRLAQSQSLASSSFANSSAVVGGGSMQITLGTVGTNGVGFTPDAAKTPTSITIAAGSTLAQVRDAINSSSAGVSASLVNDASGSRLVMRSTESGALAGFRIDVTDDDGSNTNASGLSRLAFNPLIATGAGRNMTLSSQGQDAEFTLDGLPLTSKSNQVEGVVDGLTLNLKKVTTSEVALTVETDKTSIRSNVDKFVKAYNDLNKLLQDSTKYDEATRTAGALQGNRTVLTMQSQIRSEMQAMMGTGSLTRLTDAGITFQRDGSLAVDDTKFSSAANTPANLRTLFSNNDASVNANRGIARRLDTLLTGLLGTDGAVSTAQESLKSRQTSIESQRSRIESRLIDVEARLRRQYTNLDATVSGMSSQLAQVQRLG